MVVLVGVSVCIFGGAVVGTGTRGVFVFSSLPLCALLTARQLTQTNDLCFQKMCIEGVIRYVWGGGHVARQLLIGPFRIFPFRSHWRAGGGGGIRMPRQRLIKETQRGGVECGDWINLFRLIRECPVVW